MKSLSDVVSSPVSQIRHQIVCQKLYPQEAKAAVIYAKLICEASVSIRSSSPRDVGGLPVACLSLLREGRLGKQLQKAEEMLLPELHWVFNSDCESDLLSVGHLTNTTSEGSTYHLDFNLPQAIYQEYRWWKVSENYSHFLLQENPVHEKQYKTSKTSQNT